MTANEAWLPELTPAQQDVIKLTRINWADWWVNRDKWPITETSVSDINSMQMCLRKWNLSSFNRRNLSRRSPAIKTWFGTGAHHALERYYGYGEDPVKAFMAWANKQISGSKLKLGLNWTSEVAAEIENAVEMGKVVLEHYKQWVQRVDDIIPVAMEWEFSVGVEGTAVPITGPDGTWMPWVIERWGEDPTAHENFQDRYKEYAWVVDGMIFVPMLVVGKMDGIVARKSYPMALLLFEHKTAENFLPEELLELDPQTSLYAWAARQRLREGRFPTQMPHGSRVAGVLYNVVRKKVPTSPKLLQSGRLSKAMNINTTYEVYMATIRRHGLNPVDYVDVLNRLRSETVDAADKFFKRIEIVRSDTELDLVPVRLAQQLKDMQTFQWEDLEVSNPRFYPNPQIDCTWKCPFREPCYAANIGPHGEAIIENLYDEGKSRGKNYTQRKAWVVKKDQPKSRKVVNPF